VPDRLERESISAFGARREVLSVAAITPAEYSGWAIVSGCTIEFHRWERRSATARHRLDSRSGVMPQRVIFWLTGVAAVALAVAMGAVLLITRPTEVEEPVVQGTDLQSRAAPDFRLTDHQGQTVSLSDFRGEPVVLTFLFTSCQDTCPLTAFKLRQVFDALEGSANKVTMLAVSVYPQNDTQDATYAFSEKFGLLDLNWHYLRGAESDLSSVWHGYGVGQSPGQVGLGPDNAVIHTDAIFVIDADGRQRRLLRSDFDPNKLASELRSLVTVQ
jgi:protein SCO1/2